MNVFGCGPEVDKCNNSCGERAICDGNGVCQPKTREDFYNPKTGKYEQFFYIGIETFPNCFYYNYSYQDTPWILPSLIDIDNTNKQNGVVLRTLIFDTIYGIYEYDDAWSQDLIFKRDVNNKVTDFNILYFTQYNVFYDDIHAKKYANKLAGSSWVGKVSSDRKRIDFTIYFYVNEKSNFLNDNPDTIKIINRSYQVHPNSKSDCKFCFSCE